MGGRTVNMQTSRVARRQFAAWALGVLTCAAAMSALLLPAVKLAAAERPADKAAKPAAEKRLGCTIRITLPINGQTVDRTVQFVRRAIERAAESQARLTLVFEFEVLPDQAEFGRGSEFGAALSLAEFLSGDELSGVRTVAYVPESIQGHALLVVMACDEIYMAKSASIGPAGVDEKVITESRRGFYREIANRRKTVPTAIALWLLDPSQQVWVVRTAVRREFVLADDLPSVKKEQVIIEQRKLFDRDDPAGSLVAQPGVLTGEEARALDVAKYLAASRLDVAKALDLPPASLEEDPSLVGNWRAVRVDLKGPISPDRVDKIIRLIQDQVDKHDANFICLWIDSPGGSLAGSQQLANYLSHFPPAKIRTAAYVPSQARSDAALVATACYQLVVGSQAELGGPGASEFSEDDIRTATTAIRDPAGPWHERSWSLVAAMINPKLTVYRCTRPGETVYFGDQELEAYEKNHPDEPKWQKNEQVTIPGRPLELSGQRARELGLAFALADNFTEFRKLYGLQHDPQLLEPGWADFLIDAMASPGLAALLLMIGFIALYIELHTPGIGVGGFVALICFVLFFWSHYLGGTAGWLEVSLFAAGVCCLLLEFFVLPGFGIFGLGGGVLVLASLILASQTFVLPQNPYQFAQLQRSLLTIFGAGVGFVVVAVGLRKWLPRAPLLSQVFLEPPAGEEADRISRRESLVNLRDLVGVQGTTTTQLTPCGKARFGDRLVDVISEGDLIARGREIEVVEVQGNRVIVREIG